MEGGAYIYLYFSICEQLADVLFRLSDVFVQDFGTIDDLRLARIEHFANLARHESLPCSRRPM